MQIINERLDTWTLDWGSIRLLDPALQRDHLNDMLKQMVENANPQDPDGGFSEAKLGRWLGWMQAAGCAMGVLNLDDAKTINIRHRD